MGEAKLEVLDLTAPLGLFTSYHDDGYVGSIKEHWGKLCKRYWISGLVSLLKGFSEEGVEGLHFIGTRNLLFYHHHICYVDTKEPAHNIANRAHEECHFLDYTGNLDMLSEKILAEQGVRIELKKIADDEVCAGIAEIFALNANGHDPHSFLKYLKGIGRCKKYLEYALHLYKCPDIL